MRTSRDQYRAVLLTVLFAGMALAGAGAPAQDVPDDAWRAVDPDNLVLIDIQYGQVAVELAPAFAPRHVERLKALIRAHFYDGLSFYRVIDGFVAQGGIGEGTASTQAYSTDMEKAWPPLKREFDRPAGENSAFTPLGNPDPFSPEAGYIDGFAAGRDPAEGQEWLLHCPGTFAFARDNDPDTATTEFYIVIGERPARLERNLTAVGRVIDGMQYIQKLTRGDPAIDSGVIQDTTKRDAILHMRVASDLPEGARPRFQVMRTDSPAFSGLLEAKRNLDSPFFFRKPAPLLDICNVPAPVRHAP